MRRELYRLTLLIVIPAALLAGPALLCRTTALPLDLLNDTAPWKADPAVRLPVSNRVLSDAIVQFRPWDVAVRRSLAAGEVPWRNPLAGDGEPLWANLQTALLSPFTWIHLLFPIGGWAWMVLLKLLATGLGGYWLARELGGEPAEAALSGFVILASGVSVVWSLYPLTSVFALLPALAASTLRLVRRPGSRFALATSALAFLAVAGGHPETLAVGAASVGALLLWRVWRAEAPSAVGRRVGAALLSNLAGILLAGVVLVPFAVVAHESQTLTARSHPAAAPFRKFAAASELLPGLLGSPRAGEIDLSGAVATGENFNARTSGFIGGLFLVFLAAGWRRLPAELRAAASVGAVALVFSWRVPGLSWVLAHVPLFGLVAPEWWVSAFVLLAGAAAGPAALAVVRCERTKLLAVIAFAAGAALLAAGVLPLLPLFRPVLESAVRARIAGLRQVRFLALAPEIYAARLPDYLRAISETAIRRSAFPGLCACVAGIGLLSRGRRRVLAVAGAAFELLGFGVGFLPSVPLTRIPGVPPVARKIRQIDPAGRWRIAAPFDVYPPNLATVDGIRDIRSYDVLERADFGAHLAQCGMPVAGFVSRPSLPDLACLGHMGVRYYLSREAPPGLARVAGAPPPGVGAYEIPGALASPVPRDSPPRGLGVGIAATAGGAVLALVAAVVARRLEAVSVRNP